MKALLITWLFLGSIFMFAVPKATQTCPFGHGLELHDESVAEYEARRRSIAADALEVATDPAEKPLAIYSGETARARTALLMVSIARFESGFCKLVDEGKQRGPAGEVCSMQVLVDARYQKGRGMVTAEGWTADELGADRKKCMRAALHKLQASVQICGDAASPWNATHKALTGADAISLYTGTRCSEGSIFALNRYNGAEKWIAAGHPVPSSSSSASTSR